MAVKKIGDWGKTKRLVVNLAPELRKSRELSLKRFGLKAEGTAKKHMSAQDLGWAPLKIATIAAKLRKGLSENILIATSSYFQSITSYVIDDTVYVGVKKTAVGSDGKTIHDIAALHEYGSISGTIPARPLWKPTLDETLIWHGKNNTPESIFMKRIKKYL